MKMLMIVFRASQKDCVQELLKECHVHAYTVIPQAIGTGEPGPAQGGTFAPWLNTVMLVALDDTQADRVGRAVKTWQAEGAKEKTGEEPSIRVFAMPCTQIA